MNRLFSILMLALALAPATAFASDREPGDDPDAGARVGKTNTYVYDDDDVVGERLSPDGVLIMGSTTRKHASMIPIRGTFTDYMIRHSWDI